MRAAAANADDEEPGGGRSYSVSEVKPSEQRSKRAGEGGGSSGAKAGASPPTAAAGKRRRGEAAAAEALSPAAGDAAERGGSGAGASATSASRRGSKGPLAVITAMRLATDATDPRFAQPNSLEFAFALEWRRLQNAEAAENARLSALQEERRARLLLEQRVRWEALELPKLKRLDVFRRNIIELGDPVKASMMRRIANEVVLRAGMSEEGWKSNLKAVHDAVMQGRPARTFLPNPAPMPSPGEPGMAASNLGYGAGFAGAGAYVGAASPHGAFAMPAGLPVLPPPPPPPPSFSAMGGLPFSHPPGGGHAASGAAPPPHNWMPAATAPLRMPSAGGWSTASANVRM